MAQKSDKMTKQELSAPDAFQLYGAEASDWLQKRGQIISTVAVVLVVGGLIAALVQYFSNRSGEAAAKQLGQTLETLERPVVEGVPLQPADGELPPFKSEKERDETTVKSLTEFRAAHKGTDSAVTAALPLGKAEYRLGNYDGALAAFGEYTKGAPKNDPLLTSAYEGQGYAHEAKGQLDQALESFKQMEQVNAGEFMQGMGQYHQARILVAQGKKDEAAQLLADLKATQANAAAGRLATERLAVLAAQGVKVPEPKTQPAATQTPDAG
ncbi:tetratricopeptide repeat protein [Archangium lansingense]|uniref:Tetratricopeptide repeat protein n=1 Tax=Archangium lansingense TaxID=2995310 RepID=A0ABT4A986_9BACT|nr:tetratricopeptide repeat protein [Archangium lansinium]MCY1078223.1 tetratricopeptide repeat protein [Archangium lansinium]